MVILDIRFKSDGELWARLFCLFVCLGVRGIFRMHQLDSRVLVLVQGTWLSFVKESGASISVY